MGVSVFMRRMPLMHIHLLLVLAFFLVSCKQPIPAVEVSVELLGFAEASVTRVVELRHWQLREIPAEPLFQVYSVTIQGRTFVCDDQGGLFNTTNKTAVIVTQELKSILTELISSLQSKVFGAPLGWAEASQHLPRMGQAKVIDVMTGLQFNVQRRAGSKHADVQPLTRADTAVMKKIYGGRWSWDRRAIIVVTEKARIAASMNGMPHGQGALKNNFSGHFCIHFQGCVTHGGSTPDPGHQLMVSKAAGSIWTLARNATPEGQLRNFVNALNEKDFWLAAMFALPSKTGDLENTLKGVQTIEIKQAVLRGPTLETATILCSGDVIYSTGKRQEFYCDVSLYNNSLVWLVDPCFISSIVNP